MTPITIECPHCNKPFELTEALAAPILDVERKKSIVQAQRQVETEREAIAARVRAEVERDFAKQLADSKAAVAERDSRLEAAKQAELAALEAKAEADQAKKDIALTVRKQVEAERAAIEQKALESAREGAAAQLKAAQDALAAKDEKLKQAEAAEIEARRVKAEAEEAKRQVELHVVRRVDEERARVRAQAEKERDDKHRLDILEKDKQLEGMREQIELLRRKGAQGSQQLTGDVLELDLLETLQNAFPSDRFERVKKGYNGGDVVQTVVSPTGAICGKILWESKRTQNWSDKWLPKLREDQRNANADIAAIATETLPGDIESIGERDGVWVTALPTVVPVAALLRHALQDVATARRAGALDDTTRSQIFAYLTSPAFRQRVTSIVEGYSEIRTDLDKERRATQLLWNKRQKQLDRILGGVTGMYGDLQGIAGPSLPTVEGLALEPPFEETAAENDADSAQNKAA